MIFLICRWRHRRRMDQLNSRERFLDYNPSDIHAEHVGDSTLQVTVSVFLLYLDLCMIFSTVMIPECVFARFAQIVLNVRNFQNSYILYSWTHSYSSSRRSTFNIILEMHC